MRFVKKEAASFLKVNQVHWQRTSLHDFSRAREIRFANLSISPCQITNLDLLRQLLIPGKLKTQLSCHYYFPVKKLASGICLSFWFCLLIILICRSLESVAGLHLLMAQYFDAISSVDFQVMVFKCTY